MAVVVVEDGKLVVYHAMDNSRELFGSPLNPLEFELDDGELVFTMSTQLTMQVLMLYIHYTLQARASRFC